MGFEPIENDLRTLIKNLVVPKGGKSLSNLKISDIYGK